MKKKAALFFKKTAKYYLQKRRYENKYLDKNITEKDKCNLRDCLLEKLKSKKIFKECIQ